MSTDESGNALTQETSTAPAESQTGISTSAFLKFIAEFSAACAFLGFFLSILLHALVFSKWKIDFVQIASPSDVLMSGMGFFVGLGLPLIAALFVGAMVSTVVHHINLERVSPKLQKIHYVFRFARYPYIILCWILIIGTTVLLSRGSLPYFWMPMEDEPDRGFINWLAIVGGLLVVLGGYFAVKNERAEKLDAVPVLTAVSGVCALLLFGFAFINYQAAQGFQQSRTIISAPAGCVGAGRVLWLGSQSTVVRCEAGQDPPKIVVLRGSEAALEVSPRVRVRRN